jgi:hypothetical protein
MAGIQLNEDMLGGYKCRNGDVAKGIKTIPMECFLREW